MFIKGLLHTAKYEKAYKSILAYIGSKYNHCVYNTCEYRYRTNGLNLLTTSRAPMTSKFIQTVLVG